MRHRAGCGSKALETNGHSITRRNSPTLQPPATLHPPLLARKTRSSHKLLSVQRRWRWRCRQKPAAFASATHHHVTMHDLPCLYALFSVAYYNKMLSYRRETALQGALWFWQKVENWNWETIFYGHYRSIFNHCDINRPENLSNSAKNAK